MYLFVIIITQLKKEKKGEKFICISVFFSEINKVNLNFNAQIVCVFKMLIK